MSEPLGKLAEAVVGVMADMSTLPKDGTNAFQNYDYTTEAMVANTVRPLLVKHGLALIPHNIVVVDSTPTAKHSKSVISAQYILVHKSGENLLVTVPGEGMDSLDKSTTKALTAAYKYAMIQMFCIGRGDDGDAGMPDRQAADLPEQSENSAVRAAAAQAAKPGLAPYNFEFKFGKHSGKMLSDVDSDYIRWFVKKMEEDVKDPSKSRFAAKNRQQLDSCLMELRARAQNAAPLEPFNEDEPQF